MSSMISTLILSPGKENKKVFTRYIHTVWHSCHILISSQLSITGVFKTTQPPQTKFTAWKLQWTAVNQTRSQHFECFIQKNCSQISFNQSDITNESFRSYWIEIKCFQVKFLYDWRQSIATFTPLILSVVAA